MDHHENCISTERIISPALSEEKITFRSPTNTERLGNVGELLSSGLPFAFDTLHQRTKKEDFICFAKRSHEKMTPVHKQESIPGRSVCLEALSVSRHHCHHHLHMSQRHTGNQPLKQLFLTSPEVRPEKGKEGLPGPDYLQGYNSGLPEKLPRADCSRHGGLDWKFAPHRRSAEKD
ncbi:hypothetical protein PFLUV_G00193070 [Perca fluviatilis]|uniref:Uncharacterized protein n=1 Tax=Perca fluviatilis TaxID=8168 RepID=A0A6A5EWF4_PERFL|nr:hypothetical protein PFLUV_G00193070 [Perca fluviatilis]